MNQQHPPGEEDRERALDGAGGGMGDGGDPAGASDGAPSPALQKELREGGLGQALAGVTGLPGLADADQEAKSKAGAESPAKE